jgi:CheY-like chemotaxis protein
MESVETQTNARIVDDQVAVRRYVMEQLHQHSIDAKTVGDKLRALEMLGRSVALFTDKVETKTEAINADQLKKDLRNHLVLLDNVRPIKTIEIIAEDAVILRDESL